jgi:hypothetical protein
VAEVGQARAEGGLCAVASALSPGGAELIADTGSTADAPPCERIVGARIEGVRPAPSPRSWGVAAQHDNVADRASRRCASTRARAAG